MDRDTAVIRSEMSQTRTDLDHKLAELQARARAMTPRRYAERHLPEYWKERVIGGFLTVIGLKMAWGMYRKRQRRPEDLRAAMVSYGRR